jgi:hypothetical protein
MCRAKLSSRPGPKISGARGKTKIWGPNIELLTNVIHACCKIKCRGSLIAIFIYINILSKQAASLKTFQSP